MYEMIKLKYNYKDLEPYYSSDMFNYHYNTLYKGYTNNLNKLMSDFNDNRIKDDFTNIQKLSKSLSFNANAYILHSLFFFFFLPIQNKTLLSKDLKVHIIKYFSSYVFFFFAYTK